eukprot:2382886-Prymnesium_polylepis.2
MDPYIKFKISSDLDIWVVPNFAQRELAFDPTATQANLEANYPIRHAGDAIQAGEVQWVDGDNEALKYRGHELKRGKIWLQTGEPKEVGFRRYYYTGWQWRVLPATACVDACPEIAPIMKRYNEWATAVAKSEANHTIVTKYLDESHSIGFHFDKPRDVEQGSLITVVKTGECGRPFELRMRMKMTAGEREAFKTMDKDEKKAFKKVMDTRQSKVKPFFSRALEPGTAVIMTLEANLKTQHGVPELKTKVGASGSIVFRTITKCVSWENAEKKVVACQRKRAGSKKRGSKKRARGE